MLTPEQVGVGTVVEISRTVAESDVYQFAGITGDGGRNHQDEAYMRTTRYGRRLVQGAYLVGLMSGASVVWAERLRMAGVSYGYDRIRFTAPVFIGESIRVRYEVASWDQEKSLVRSNVTCLNERGEIVAVATHILKLFPEGAIGR
ncbi:MAG: MaoC/PaaZ C-terminal domain-containing protein [Armatimonadota bacterium]|nr:MaoC/PaaZ C-terminal domain-containing protein [Armatimonadota bacterium]MDR7422577.1 MaoC/PaaZ C-terminal domain-containing protein [Armatimonadota bacterium]MDR7453925.1 MaoC/PaaZ C-terminal domain-containing protein [Armatimonadota bacterium]MDR7457668.1 MaoC/PaaZ C-terminal domain-containing protein [Armatimonadota bacterium]MDR7511031.1 MaoC/PaaZ C-terminal domain-containing protein [Armatimonadota bacterium]